MTDNNKYNLNFDIDSLDWEKCQGMIPVIVQNYRSGLVLMQGFMNREALEKTMEIGRVTFWSRTKKRLWTKGEESRHYLNLKAITTDCDSDCLLIAADPIGPTCHLGNTSCFDGHLPLDAANISVYDALQEEQTPLPQAVSEFEAAATPENGARLLKAVMGALQKNGIRLRDIDGLFRQ